MFIKVLGVNKALAHNAVRDGYHLKVASLTGFHLTKIHDFEGF